MYVSFRWRDTLREFSFALSFSLSLLPLWFIIYSNPSSGGDTALAIGRMWQYFGVLAGVLAGMPIGSPGMGANTGAVSSDFVFTRPLSRKYLAWMGWAIGVVEVFAIIAAMILITAGLLWYQQGFYWWYWPPNGQQGLVLDIPLQLASVPVFALVVYTATYFASVLTRRRSIAITLTLGLGAVYQLVASKVAWAHAHLPEILVTPYHDVLTPHLHYVMAALGGMILWIICAFLFVYAAQLVFERSEL